MDFPHSMLLFFCGLSYCILCRHCSLTCGTSHVILQCSWLHFSVHVYFPLYMLPIGAVESLDGPRKLFLIWLSLLWQCLPIGERKLRQPQGRGWPACPPPHPISLACWHAGLLPFPLLLTSRSAPWRALLTGKWARLLNCWAGPSNQWVSGYN